jgi:DNA glycosylase AlkZ-like
MNDDKLRAWWFHRQGLDGSLAGCDTDEVLRQTGWARSVAGSGPYLTFFSRAVLSRHTVDDAVASLAIHELPSARGCTYVLPKEDFALGLSVGQDFSKGELATARKLGVTDAELQKLETAILKALRNGSLLPDEIREAVGPASRNLGSEGKKKGLTTTLPISLGNLQALGCIRRIPVNGRLDQQRYRYAIWDPNPLRGFAASPADTYTELARRYFQWIGPAALAEFQWFSGLGVKASQAAIAPLKLVPAEANSDRLMLANDLPAFNKFKTPTKSVYALVSSLDAMFLLRRNIATLMPPAALRQKVYGEKGMSELGGLVDLSSNAILDRGSIVGLWEFDPETSALVWFTFAKPDRALRDCIAKTEAYVLSQLGDVRSFSLDSPRSRTPRIEAIRMLNRE